MVVRSRVSIKVLDSMWFNLLGRVVHDVGCPITLFFLKEVRSSGWALHQRDTRATARSTPADHLAQLGTQLSPRLSSPLDAVPGIELLSAAPRLDLLPLRYCAVRSNHSVDCPMTNDGFWLFYARTTRNIYVTICIFCIFFSGPLASYRLLLRAYRRHLVLYSDFYFTFIDEVIVSSQRDVICRACI